VNRINRPKLTNHRYIRITLSILKNKYFIFTAIIIAWLIFFDRYNVRTRISDRVKLHKMKEDRDYYKAKADEARKSYNELFSSPEQLEKFAREKYYMKKDSEDVYIVEE
jgi:cell division protein DivIC